MDSNGTKEKRRSALGNDPFEDMESLDWPTIDEAPAVNHKQGQPDSSTESGAKSDFDNFTSTEAPLPDLKIEQPVPDETAAASIDKEIDALEIAKVTQPLDDIIAAIDAEIKQGFGAVPLDLQGTSRLKHTQNEQQFIVFTLAHTNYAAPIANVSEVGSLTDYTFVPNVPNWLVGVTNWRGDILSAVDLGAFLGLESAEDNEAIWAGLITGKERDMLVTHLSKNRSRLTVGLLVDAIRNIRYLDLYQIDAPTITITDSIKPYLRGIYDDNGELLVVLDFDELLLSPQMQQFEPV